MSNDPRIHPIFQVRGERGAPEHGMFSLYATSDDKYEEAQNDGGAVSLRRYALDNVKASFYKNRFTDNETERRSRAVSLDYTLPPQDEYNTVQAWESVYTDRERAQIDTQIANYQNKVDDLNSQKAEDPNNALSAQKQEQLADFLLVLGQLRGERTAALSGGNGFLFEVPSVFGYGGKCIHDGNGAPNVTKIRRSTFLVDSDRAFHLARRFAIPNEQQRTTSEKLRFGPFILEINGGSTVKLWMYAKEYYSTGSDAEISVILPLETELEELLDEARITDEDAEYINERKTAIRTLEKEARSKKIKSDTPEYKPYYEQTQTAREEINARQKLKRNPSGASEERVREIIQTLYQIRGKSINLQEDSENFYGNEGIMRLTIIPQKRGFLTLVLTGNDPVTIEIPDIIETRKYGSLWHPTELIIESKGGSQQWQFLYPAVASTGEFRLKNVDVPFVLKDSDEIFFDGDWDKSGPGCDINFTVEQSENFSEARPMYDFVAYMRADVGKREDSTNTKDIINSFFPWLYSLQFTINSGELPYQGDILWNSADFGSTLHWYGTPFNPNVDNPILAVSLSQDPIESGWRGMRLEIDIADPNGTANFKGYEEHWCDFSAGLWQEPTSYTGGVLDWPEGTTNGVSGVLPYLQDGIITEAVLINVIDLGNKQESEEHQKFRIDSFWRISVADIFAVLDNHALEYDIILDDLTCGAALHRLIGAVGIPASKLTGIATVGSLAGSKTPKSGAGEMPRKVARQGQKVGPMAIEILNEYGMSGDYKELSLNYRGGVFNLVTASDTVVAAYTSAPAGTSAYNVILEGAQQVKNWHGINNIYNVEGRRDRKTGKSLKARYAIPESWLPGYENSPVRIGFPKAAPLIKRPELDSQELVEEAVNIAAVRGFKSGDSEVWETFWLYPPRYVDDFISIDGTPREITRIQDMNIRILTSCPMVTRPRVELP